MSGWEVELVRQARTDREVWATSDRGFHFWVLTRERMRSDINDGLKALAKAWFDEYEDEQHLPEWFWEVVDFAENSLGDLNLPDRTDDDEDSIPFGEECGHTFASPGEECPHCGQVKP